MSYVIKIHVKRKRRPISDVKKRKKKKGPMSYVKETHVIRKRRRMSNVKRDLYHMCSDPTAPNRTRTICKRKNHIHSMYIFKYIYIYMYIHICIYYIYVYIYIRQRQTEQETYASERTTWGIYRKTMSVRQTQQHVAVNFVGGKESSLSHTLSFSPAEPHANKRITGGIYCKTMSVRQTQQHVAVNFVGKNEQELPWKKN